MGASGFPGILDPDFSLRQISDGSAFGRPDEFKRNPTPSWRNTIAP
jgi:hypothetical protein